MRTVTWRGVQYTEDFLGPELFELIRTATIGFAINGEVCSDCRAKDRAWLRAFFFGKTELETVIELKLQQLLGD